MFISKVYLNNFRVYKGENQIAFKREDNKNVTIIAGNNGFGKTSFLTSLVWCFYGKFMQDVEKKYKEEIYDSGGYKKYASSNLNNLAHSEGDTQYSVSITITDIFIPAIPCKVITIVRSFNVTTEEDSIRILIDGNENELTKEVGNDIFINDFILPKEIAKFFFFDAEKIVSLAEMKSLQDKKNLSKAYSEVLGIKKYEDLKENLENLRIRFRRNSATVNDRKKLETLNKEIHTGKEFINLYEINIKNLQEEKLYKKGFSEQLQEKLIREGNSMSDTELAELKKLKQNLIDEHEGLKSKLKDLLELAPFAIASKTIISLEKQLEYELQVTKLQLNPETATSLSKKINSDLKKLNLSKELIVNINDIISKHLIKGDVQPSQEEKILHSFQDVEINEFNAILNNIKYAFSYTFKQVTKEIRNNRILFNKVVRQITDAESKENDLLIKEIRKEKNVIDKRIDEIDSEIIKLSIEIENHRRELIIKAKQEAELSKIVRLEESDKLKDETAQRLITELDSFIYKLKNNKKQSLESKIKAELNKLMHKSNFVDKVKVTIEHDLIDIFLFNKRGEIIPKESLSKGEQQLYATSLLKALVDESNIKFPIFIDSPLQKFDPYHTKNIISEFYPFISEQVVLLPLLKKELTESEYYLLLPRINDAYFITSIDQGYSSFAEIEPEKIFKHYDSIYEPNSQLNINF
ncbi:AAA family ATPase [Emticicia soli]|uniref:AAA family ATPase n=1 Tax=Emticicia soli TaxID=2027878 RepID=A0ABW5JEE2_9BACT